MVGNIIPYIGGEEEKSEKEPLRIWGHVDAEKKAIVPAESPVITCQCIRVPVLNGHTAAVFVKFKKNPTKEQLIEALKNFSGVPQELGLPSAPKQFIQYLEEDNRPQVSLDVNYENGMGISVGRSKRGYRIRLEVCRTFPQYSPRCSRRCSTLRRTVESTGIYHKEIIKIGNNKKRHRIRTSGGVLYCLKS